MKLWPGRIGRPLAGAVIGVDDGQLPRPHRHQHRARMAVPAGGSTGSERDRLCDDVHAAAAAGSSSRTGRSPCDAGSRCPRSSPAPDRRGQNTDSRRGQRRPRDRQQTEHECHQDYSRSHLQPPFGLPCYAPRLWRLRTVSYRGIAVLLACRVPTRPSVWARAVASVRERQSSFASVLRRASRPCAD